MSNFFKIRGKYLQNALIEKKSFIAKNFFWEKVHVGYVIVFNYIVKREQLEIFSFVGLCLSKFSKNGQLFLRLRNAIKSNVIELTLNILHPRVLSFRIFSIFQHNPRLCRLNFLRFRRQKAFRV